MKGLRLTENVKEIKFEGVWGELKSKKVSRDNTHKIFETNSTFHVKQCTT